MRIGTYNVLGLTGFPSEESSQQIGTPGSAENTAHFAAVFAALDCQVLGLQEGVAVGTAQRLANQLDCHLATCPSPIAWPGHVLSRYPILESRTFSHTGPTDETPPFSRTAGAALLEIGAETIWFCNVHLHPGDEQLRQREGQILSARLAALAQETDRIVVLGDFNSEVDEPVHQSLKAMGFVNAMENKGGGIQVTMDTVGIRQHSIDHIYLSAALAPHLQSAEVVRRPGFRHDGPQEAGVWVHSDHLPVLAEIDWPG